ncbi:hypothetical protein GM3708_1868 [Geminocystis sp. NIES-3708]|nr:hypothetical protein [Geminocystis sp. NIES-3708]BAQ61462.1 hypothetical protein GM3708_1868 [Geminocystis sp. NIES-3708]
MCQYLGLESDILKSLESHPVKSKYQKVSSDNLADEIENYEEIIDKLQQS